MLVAGVMIFSYIMGNFIAMIEGYKQMKSDIEHDDSLSKFFGLLKRFNNGKEMKLSLKEDIQDYFTLRW
jgi:ABC-type siderophore export system fused ATPase/permease subunit